MTPTWLEFKVSHEVVKFKSKHRSVLTRLVAMKGGHGVEGGRAVMMIK